MTKIELRQIMRQKRKEILPRQREMASDAVLGMLLAKGVLHENSKVGVYAACAGELEVQPIVDWYWQRNQAVYFPVVSGADLIFRSGLISSKWEMGEYQIPIPVDDTSEAVVPDLVLVPTVAFNYQGFRLGQGGGFYDRLMQASREKGYKTRFIGVAFSIQAYENLPVDSWDQPLDAIVTEESYELLVNEI